MMMFLVLKLWIKLLFRQRKLSIVRLFPADFSLSIAQVPFRVEYVTGIAQQDSGSLNCGVVVAVYAEYLCEGLGIPSSGIDAQYHRMRYATLLCKYGFVNAEKRYFSENDDPPRSRSNFAQNEKICALHIE
ncbi:hypothetical protein P3S68_005006 [Capsicum galapagoense]